MALGFEELRPSRAIFRGANTLVYPSNGFFIGTLLKAPVDAYTCVCDSNFAFVNFFKDSRTDISWGSQLRMSQDVFAKLTQQDPKWFCIFYMTSVLIENSTNLVDRCFRGSSTEDWLNWHSTYTRKNGRMLYSCVNNLS
jgi:hypothetical protein